MSKPVPLPAPWVRTARGNPCPVCHCHAGCLLSGPTDPSAAICRNADETAEPIGTRGFLHVLRDGPTWARWRMSLERLKKGTP